MTWQAEKRLDFDSGASLRLRYEFFSKRAGYIEEVSQEAAQVATPGLELEGKAEIVIIDGTIGKDGQEYPREVVTMGEIMVRQWSFCPKCKGQGCKECDGGKGTVVRLVPLESISKGGWGYGVKAEYARVQVDFIKEQEVEKDYTGEGRGEI